jgi:DNA polymerase IV
MLPRKIVHIDMDAFYASVEQRDDSQLRGKPVVVAWRGNRSVVCAASYEARKFGVRSAMPAVRAERLCPNAVFLPPDFPRYRAVSRQVREILQRHTDLIEPLSLDEAYLDVSENKTGLPTATQVARTIREQIRSELSLTASAGVAPNKFLAKIASDWKKPDGLFVIQPEEIDSFLLPLPIDRLPGVGKVTEEKLKHLEVQTIADLRRMALPTLEDRFGRYGVRLYELARGIDKSEVVPDRPTQIRRGYLSTGCLAGRDGADDPKTCGARMGRVAQRITNRPHGRSQIEDERVQDSHSEPYAPRTPFYL